MMMYQEIDVSTKYEANDKIKIQKITNVKAKIKLLNKDFKVHV